MVSARSTLSDDKVAASLAPPMVIVTTFGVPSMVVTVKVSVSVAAGVERLDRPLPLSSVYFQTPADVMVHVP